MTPQRARREIAWLKRWFRCLKGWRIRYYEINGHAGHGRVVYVGRTSAVIMPGDFQPVDYLFHEVMHCAVQSLLRVRGRKAKAEAEEQFIQDVCKVYRHAKGSPS